MESLHLAKLSDFARQPHSFATAVASASPTEAVKKRIESYLAHYGSESTAENARGAGAPAHA